MVQSNSFRVSMFLFNNLFLHLLLQQSFDVEGDIPLLLAILFIGAIYDVRVFQVRSFKTRLWLTRWINEKR